MRKLVLVLSLVGLNKCLFVLLSDTERCVSKRSTVFRDASVDDLLLHVIGFKTEYQKTFSVTFRVVLPLKPLLMCMKPF